MASNSITYTVKDLVDLGIIEKPLDGNHGGIHPKSSDYVEYGVPFIMASDLINGHVDIKGCKFITEEQAKSLRKGFAKEGDVLLSHKATIGRTAIVGTLPTDFIVLTPQITYYRALDLTRLNPKYLKYYFDSEAFQALFEQWAGGGSTRLYLGITEQMKLPIELPDIKIQNKIVDLVDSFDRKITLNRQINQTLEQMAQALFKSWFVDFDPVVDNALDAGFFEQDLDLPDELLRRAEARRLVRKQCDFKPLPDATRQLFPAAFEESTEPSLGLGGWVPKGWSVKTCEDISEKIGMGPFGSNIKISTFVKDGVPVISGTHLKQVLLEDHDYNFITKEHALKLKNSCVYRGDIIFTHAGNIGQVSLIPAESAYERYIISQRQFYMRPDKNKISSSYLVYFFHSHDGQHKLLSNASQTGVPSIARPSTHLKSISLITPDMTVQNIFEHYVTRWNKKIIKSREHIISLTNLRDALLPKLISGELRLDNIAADLATEQVN